MLQDLIKMIVSFYNLDTDTDKGQRELNRLTQIYGADIKLYKGLVSDYKLLKVA